MNDKSPILIHSTTSTNEDNMPKPAIKTTWGTLAHKTGNAGVDYIAVRHLGKYGFDDAIIRDMIKFDIFPQVYLVTGETYVLRADIFGKVVRKLLSNSMIIYQGVADADEMREKIKAATEDLLLDDDTVAKLTSGEWTLDQAREHSKTVLAQRETEPEKDPA